ncbi:hypothetical protein PanWU01x14_319230 [Parasponia andersonii]|uniref:Uncharacterized protein n=1 Tax=Parasponia andersonii TaxID=3476 RepID=A0A2P5AM76_PARAD|nr:hypothetical protein PanWU01x14_319230 [Parasponia andersonii]
MMDLRRRGSKDGSGFGLAKPNGDPLKAELVGVPEVEAGSSVPSQEISGPWAGVGVVVWAGGRGEDRVVLEGNPFDLVFGRGGPYLIRFLLLKVQVEPHFRARWSSPAIEPALKPWFCLPGKKLSEISRK